MHSTVNGTKEFAALDPSKIAAIKGINQLALIKHFDNLQLAIGLITVFAAILTSRQSGQKLQCLYGNPVAYFTQFMNHNVKILSRRLYSPSLKNYPAKFTDIWHYLMG